MMKTVSIRWEYKIKYDKKYHKLFASQQSTIARYRMNDNGHSLFGMKTSWIIATVNKRNKILN